MTQANLICRSENPQSIRNIIDENELVYASRVLWLCREMQVDEVRKLDPTNSNYTRFVGVIKSIIDLKLDQSFGFNMEFNPTFTALKKLGV